MSYRWLSLHLRWQLPWNAESESQEFRGQDTCDGGQRAKAPVMKIRGYGTLYVAVFHTMVGRSSLNIF